jgi:hypothetical protein
MCSAADYNKEAASTGNTLHPGSALSRPHTTKWSPSERIAPRTGSFCAVFIFYRPTWAVFVLVRAGFTACAMRFQYALPRVLYRACLPLIAYRAIERAV